MTLEQEQEFERLRAENAELRQLLAVSQWQLATVAVALERIAELEAQLKQGGGPPAFVKPNRSERRPSRSRARSGRRSTTRRASGRRRPASSGMPWSAARTAIIGLQGESLDYTRKWWSSRRRSRWK